MKELLYAVAICITLGAGWVFSQLPSKSDVDQAWRDSPRYAIALKDKREDYQAIFGLLLAGASVFGLAGFSVQMRERAK